MNNDAIYTWSKICDVGSSVTHRTTPASTKKNDSITYYIKKLLN
jgi:hypothetical protein